MTDILNYLAEHGPAGLFALAFGAHVWWGSRERRSWSEERSAMAQQAAEERETLARQHHADQAAQRERLSTLAEKLAASIRHDPER